jgi:hypothetical protein
MQIEDIEQPEKVLGSIHESREPRANVTVERKEHREKQPWPMVSTLEGMQIDEREEQPTNALSPRKESWQPNSNATLRRV